ncbi:MAG: hypothetical protein ACK44D_14165, partial [Bacteroidia bacterium]
LTLTGDGNITIAGIIGGTTPISSLTINGNGTTYLGENISTQGNTITFDTPVVLTDNVTLVDTGTTGIIFNDTVNGNYNLTLTATNGDINFNALVGDSTRLAAVTVNNAIDISSAALFRTTDFTQVSGSGTTAFSSGLHATNDISIDTNNISGSYIADAMTLAAVNNYTASVMAASLTLDGQDGANITGTVAGIGGVEAALLTNLGGSASGLFYVNGCLVGTACGANSGSGDPTVTQNDQTLLPDNETLENNTADDNNQNGSCKYTDPTTGKIKSAKGKNCVNIDVKSKPGKANSISKQVAKVDAHKTASGTVIISKTLAIDLVFAK